MIENLIHPTAIVSEKASLGENVKVGPYSIIEDDVIVGDNTEIRAHVTLANGTRLGKDCSVYSYAIIGTEPQDLKFDNEPTFVFIGDRTMIREFVTINRGTHETGKTVLGDDCLIMTYCHIAHDCRIGCHVIMSNLTQLAGHVHLEDWVITGGVVKVVQFNTVGKHCMVGADVKVTKDVPPFTLIGRVPPKIEGINKIGLRRRGFSRELIQELDDFYETILFSGLNISDGIREFQKRDNISDDVKYCIEFIEKSTRGVHR